MLYQCQCNVCCVLCKCTITQTRHNTESASPQRNTTTQTRHNTETATLQHHTTTQKRHNTESATPQHNTPHHNTDTATLQHNTVATTSSTATQSRASSVLYTTQVFSQSCSCTSVLHCTWQARLDAWHKGLRKCCPLGIQIRSIFTK